MIISNVIGGLGNQMFQYAAGLSLAQERKTNLILATDMFHNYSLHQGYELDHVFGITTQFASKEMISQLIGWRSNSNVRKLLSKASCFRFLHGSNFSAEFKDMSTDKFFSLSSNTYLHGYWQSERFFKKHSKIILDAFIFSEKLSLENNEILNEMQNSPSASIHIRRGDYLKGRNAFIYHHCTPDYFYLASNYLSEKIANLKFYVFSDDPIWANNLFKDKGHNFKVISHNSGKLSYNDMRLISSCDHNIISNSSFSWWGAWLNTNENKIVISPKQWMTGVPSSEIVPSNWITI